MKKLFIAFMKTPAFKNRPEFSSPASISTMFNAWLVSTMNHPTEFSNKFMVRKFLEKFEVKIVDF